MFVLTKVENDMEKILLIPSKATYTIGRLSTDVILSEDLSISRTHVKICPSNGGSLTVEDLGSRYGTFINDDIERSKKMSAKTPTPLHIGDRIRFGALKNVWKLSQLKLLTTASALNATEIHELNNLIKSLNGAIVPSWTDECSHLTMDTVTITVKLLHALLDNKPIVRIDFWRELVKLAKRVHVPNDLPKPEDYMPKQPEDMPSIKWRPERTKLFAGKTFVFMNRKHLDMYGTVVQKASGACKDLNSGVRKPFLTKPNVIVIQYVSSTQSQATETIFSVQGILEQAGLRPVPDYEIGLAILHCSLEKFCNPSYKITENSLATTESMDSSILVPNTERSQTQRAADKASEFFVPESQKSQIYALRTGSEKQSSEPKPEPVKKPTRMMPKKRNNAIYLDSSSDEDIQVEVVEVPNKKAKTVIENNSKRKIESILDSSDDDQSKKKSKSSLEPSLNSSVNIPPVDTNQKNATEPATTPSRRSTRAHPLQQIEAETEKPEISPRRSARGKPAEKKATLQIVRSDSEDDEELFQFKSQASAPVEQAPIQPTETSTASESTLAKQAAPSPKINKKGTISVRNFLEKSQSQASSQNFAPPASQKRKRLCLKLISESDSDDDENLFQFGDGRKRKQTRVGSDNESDNENMFNFQGRDQQEHSKAASEHDEDSVSTEPFVNESKPKSKYIVRKPSEQPRKVNVSGWLSCSGLHEDVKPEVKPELQIDADAEAIKQELDEDDKEKLDHVKWLASLKDSIQVRMCNMSISVRSADQTDAANTTDNKYSGRQNFKKFVKKSNVHSQQHTVGLKRMQLAEGMVSSL
ncbi:nibrin [Drosophila mojavensis]|uniref:nibrin n=1 Tax=Drosophila mojavensis TaxID=7230 RepID=UPI001CD0556F|nr:nibrin [Drosophila mojavensis]